MFIFSFNLFYFLCPLEEILFSCPLKKKKNHAAFHVDVCTFDKNKDKLLKYSTALVKDSRHQRGNTPLIDLRGIEKPLSAFGDTLLSLLLFYNKQPQELTKQPSPSATPTPV